MRWASAVSSGSLARLAEVEAALPLLDEAADFFEAPLGVAFGEDEGCELGLGLSAGKALGAEGIEEFGGARFGASCLG